MQIFEIDHVFSHMLRLDRLPAAACGRLTTGSTSRPHVKIAIDFLKFRESARSRKSLETAANFSRFESTFSRMMQLSGRSYEITWQRDRGIETHYIKRDGVLPK